jgi:hypothetical protein
MRSAAAVAGSSRAEPVGCRVENPCWNVHLARGGSGPLLISVSIAARRRRRQLALVVRCIERRAAKDDAHPMGDVQTASSLHHRCPCGVHLCMRLGMAACFRGDLEEQCYTL